MNYFLTLCLSFLFLATLNTSTVENLMRARILAEANTTSTINGTLTVNSTLDDSFVNLDGKCSLSSNYYAIRIQLGNRLLNDSVDSILKEASNGTNFEKIVLGQSQFYYKSFFQGTAFKLSIPSTSLRNTGENYTYIAYCLNVTDNETKVYSNPFTGKWKQPDNKGVTYKITGTYANLNSDTTIIQRYQPKALISAFYNLDTTSRLNGNFVVSVANETANDPQTRILTNNVSSLLDNMGSLNPAASFNTSLFNPGALLNSTVFNATSFDTSLFNPGALLNSTVFNATSLDTSLFNTTLFNTTLNASLFNWTSFDTSLFNTTQFNTTFNTSLNPTVFNGTLANLTADIVVTTYLIRDPYVINDNTSLYIAQLASTENKTRFIRSIDDKLRSYTITRIKNVSVEEVPNPTVQILKNTSNSSSITVNLVSPVDGSFYLVGTADGSYNSTYLSSSDVILLKNEHGADFTYRKNGSLIANVSTPVSFDGLTNNTRFNLYAVVSDNLPISSVSAIVSMEISTTDKETGNFAGKIKCGLIFVLGLVMVLIN